MPKYPEFKSKPIVGLEEGDWDKWSMKRISNLENLSNITPEDIKRRSKKASESLKGHEVSKEARAKIGAARKGKPISQEVKDKISETLSGKNTGSENSNYGSGKLYKELLSGFVGHACDHCQEFGINTSYLVDRYLGKVKIKGKHKGRCWVEVASQD